MQLFASLFLTIKFLIFFKCGFPFKLQPLITDNFREMRICYGKPDRFDESSENSSDEWSSAVEKSESDLSTEESGVENM